MKTTERTDKENIAYVFACVGIPDQTSEVNGSGQNFVDIGDALCRLSDAKDLYGSGDIYGAEQKLNELMTTYSILKEQLSMSSDFPTEEDNTIFRTDVEEPVDVPTIIVYSMGRLKTGMYGLETAIKAEEGNINKSGQEPKNGGVDFVIL